MKKFLFLISALTLAITLQSCKDSGYKQTETGLTYKFHRSNKGEKPAIDNIVKIDFAYRYPADSVFFHSNQAGPAGYIKVEPSGYPGDIYEALRMMAKGDSASFRFDAQSFFTISAGSPMVPDFINPEDSIYVDIVMHDFFNEEQYEKHLQAEREEMLKEQEVKSANETKALEQYLVDNNIDVQPEESGLVIIVKEDGKGATPVAGQTVTVHYTGMLMDGTVFDSSVERGDPFTFNLGMGQVIRGWDEGISKIKVGSKARLIIPSHLAYGDRDRGPIIKGFSTLIFDIELIDAK
jgi:FKBP-type peptidyl-prolyl cis-trans isomerase FkpA